MNYRHSFHAGNFADVLKHAVLALVIEHLKKKPTPFRVIDTHAGAGSYRLDASEAQRTGEWLAGIGRLLGRNSAPLPADVAELLQPYLSVVVSANSGDEALVCYPGSPAIALASIRACDRLIANELHPDDADTLRRQIGGDHRVKVMTIDGWQALKALLPPKERRGVILIDPPFEEAGEVERLVQGLSAGMRRFATGTYLLWFPIKEEAVALRLRHGLTALKARKLLYLELATRAANPLEKLSATGLAILNPPFQLEAQLGLLLPFLAERLRQGPGHGYRLEWLSPAR